MTHQALSLRCPKCGFQGSVTADAMREAGERAAEQITPAFKAARFREVARDVVAAFVPPGLRRIALAAIDHAPDERCAALAESIVARLLVPDP